MKTELALISVLALAGVALFMQGPGLLQKDNVFTAYENWKIEFGKTSNGEEDAYRFAQFAINYDFIERHNAEGHRYTLGLTQFAAMDVEEYKGLLLNSMIPEGTDLTPGEDIPKPNAGDIDWVQKGVVNPVQNQGNCGSCWAFASTSSSESIQAIKNGKLYKWSEQQVTSCDTKSFGCNGGYVIYAYNYSQGAGFETEKEYPYEQLNNPKTQPCKYNQKKAQQNPNGAGNQIKAAQPNAMLQQMETQPFAVNLDAGNVYFQLYKGGVLDNRNCGNQLNHSVAAVGYNSSQNYWTIKNSWGTGWGDKGYIMIANVNGNGICGVNMYPTFPSPPN